jgi:cation diffusion facilitator family transporter
MGSGHHHQMQGNLKVQATAVIVGLVILLIKFSAWMITGSNAILSDALESIINVLAGSLAFVSIYYASQPRDDNHPYGHGKIEFVSSGFEGLLILIAGIIIIGKAIYNLIFPQELEELGLGMLLSGGAGLVNFILAVVLINRGKKTKSVAMEADGKHLMSDAYSTIGMLIGLLIVWLTNMVWLDNAVAIIFGALLLRIGYKVTKDALAGILDETDLALVDQFIAILERHRKPEWIDIHKFRIIKFGSVLHVDCHVTVPWYYTVQQAHQIVDEIEHFINHEMDQQVELFIHTDPCRPQACVLCSVENCAVRQHPFKERLSWNKDNVLHTERHDFTE